MFTTIYYRVTFIRQRGDLCEIIVNPFTIFVPFRSSVLTRESVDQHGKHHHRSFIDGCTKDFVSNLTQGVIFDFYPEGVYHRDDLCHLESKKPFSLRRRRSENDFFNVLGGSGTVNKKKMKKSIFNHR